MMETQQLTYSHIVVLNMVKRKQNFLQGLTAYEEYYDSDFFDGCDSDCGYYDLK